MTVIIKNTTGSDIFVNNTGDNIPASGQQTVSPRYYLSYSAASIDDTSFIADINSGDLVVNDGVTDLSSADGLRYLQQLTRLRVSLNSSEIEAVVENLNFTGGDVSVATSTAGEATVTLPERNLGIYQLHFGNSGEVVNEYVELPTNSTASSETPQIIPFASKVIAYTFTNNDNDSDPDIEIYSVPENSGNSPITLKDIWSIRDGRTARKTNFPTDITFAAGDKVTVFFDDMGINPDDVLFTIYLQITSLDSTEVVESWSGDIEPV